MKAWSKSASAIFWIGLEAFLLYSPKTARASFWNASGTQLHAEPVNLAAKQVLVLNTATIAAVNGQSGAITVTHDGRYGDLSGKTVALEPATGFSFDSPMIAR